MTSNLLNLARQWVIDKHPNQSEHLLRAEYWLGQIAPDAPLSVQMATLTHDMERAFPGDDAPEDRGRQWLTWSFRGALQDANYTLPGYGDFSDQVSQAGFLVHAREHLPAIDSIRWDHGWTLIEARSGSEKQPAEIAETATQW